MSARFSLALGTAFAALATWFPSAPTNAQPAAGKAPFRVHIDPGHHVGWVEKLFFRNNDTELVSVGGDQSVRVWNTDPAKGAPRAGSAFFLSGVPASAALSPNGKQQFMAVGFVREPDAVAPVVRVLDLAARAENNEFRAPTLALPAKTDAVDVVLFSPNGQDLLIGGPKGTYWIWSEKDWAKPAAAEPKPMSIKGMENHPVTAAAFYESPTGTFLAVGGTGPEVFTSANFRDFNDTRTSIVLPGKNLKVHAIAWGEHGLAVGYFAHDGGPHGHARVAVFQMNKDGAAVGKPAVADLGVGFTTGLAWLPTPDKTLLVSRASDGDASFEPALLRLGAAGKLADVSDEYKLPADRANRAGLTTCAAGRNSAAVQLAWASAAQGTIEVARPAVGKPGALALHPLGQPGETWYTRAAWDDERGEIVLTGVGGREARVWDNDLWKIADLSAPGKAFRTQFPDRLAAPTDDPEYCRADLPGGGKVLGTAFRLWVGRAIGEVVQQRYAIFLGVRSLITFEKSRTVIAHRSNGELCFWEYRPEAWEQPGSFPLTLKATARLREGQLRYRSALSRSHEPAAEVVEVDQQFFGDETAYRRVYAQVGPGLRRNPRVVAGLDTDVVLPGGDHQFRVDVPDDGELIARVNGRTIREVRAQAKRGDKNELTVALAPEDRSVEVMFIPTDGEAGRVVRRAIQVGEPGRLVLFDVTPQKPPPIGTDTVHPDDPTKQRRRTAWLLAEVLKKMGVRPVERRSANDYESAERELKALLGPAATGGLGPNDCVVFLYKGHGELIEGANGAIYPILKSDDYVEGLAKAGKETGITLTRLAGLVGGLRGRTDKVVVILDCCNAENFLPAVGGRDTTVYPCSLRGESSEARVLPDALDELLTEIQNLPLRSPGLICQDDLLRAIKDRCYRIATKKPESPLNWGYESAPRRFVIAHK